MRPVTSAVADTEILAGPTLRGLRCVRCGRRTGLRYDCSGCEACGRQGVPSALLAEHDLTSVDGTALWRAWGRRSSGMWSYREMLPTPWRKAVSLREGATPLLALEDASNGDRPSSPVLIKDERRNPTGSFKDRFYSAAVSWAAGTEAHTVTVASSGNAGVSVAAYCAAAGLDCEVVASADIDPTWRGLIELYGAKLVFAEDGASRWDILAAGESDPGRAVLTNTSAIPVSSLWVGIEGYKTIAYEIVADLGDAPEAVVVPVSRGDGFAGLWAGFRELRELGIIDRPPRMIAAERYPSLTAALRDETEPPPEIGPEPDDVAPSIGNPRATVMSLSVLRESGGTAVPCSAEELTEAVARLAAKGIAAEPASAAPLVAIDRLRRGGLLDPEERVVGMVTSDAAHQSSALPTKSD